MLEEMNLSRFTSNFYKASKRKIKTSIRQNPSQTLVKKITGVCDRDLSTKEAKTTIQTHEIRLVSALQRTNETLVLLTQLDHNRALIIEPHKACHELIQAMSLDALYNDEIDKFAAIIKETNTI